MGDEGGDHQAYHLPLCAAYLRDAAPDQRRGIVHGQQAVGTQGSADNAGLRENCGRIEGQGSEFAAQIGFGR